MELLKINIGNCKEITSIIDYYLSIFNSEKEGYESFMYNGKPSFKIDSSHGTQTLFPLSSMNHDWYYFMVLDHVDEFQHWQIPDLCVNL